MPDMQLSSFLGNGRAAFGEPRRKGASSHAPPAVDAGFSGRCGGRVAA